MAKGQVSAAAGDFRLAKRECTSPGTPEDDGAETPRKADGMEIGPTELIVVLLIVLLVFGVGRIGQIGKEMGTAIHEFRKGLRGDGPEEPSSDAGSSGKPRI